jgi:hypothetical protein
VGSIPNFYWLKRRKAVLFQPPSSCNSPATSLFAQNHCSSAINPCFCYNFITFSIIRLRKWLVILLFFKSSKWFGPWVPWVKEPDDPPRRWSPLSSNSQWPPLPAPAPAPAPAQCCATSSWARKRCPHGANGAWSANMVSLKLVVYHHFVYSKCHFGGVPHSHTHLCGAT